MGKGHHLKLVLYTGQIFHALQKRYWGFWNRFLTNHIIPTIANIDPTWHKYCSPRSYSTYYKHVSSPHLYSLQDNELTCFKLNPNPRLKPRIFYHCVPYQCDHTFTSTEFYPVDIQFIKQGIIILGPYFGIILTTHTAPPQSLQEAFHALPLSLCRICGHVTFPPDNCAKLKQTLKHLANSLYSASDASLKDERAYHAWIVSAGNIENINDNDMNILGAGPVDGLSPFLSSAWAELTGITAISIIARLFLDFHSIQAKIETYCDNLRVINKCQSMSFSKLRRHREPMLTFSLHRPP